MRDAILYEARQCLGTPFRHQGRVKGRGLDCVGLLVVIARQLNINVIDRLDYGRRPAFNALERQLTRSGLIANDRLIAAPGDIALFKIERAPQHVAVLSERNTIIHAYIQARRVVEHRLDGVWRDRLVQTYRFPGVETWQV